MEKIQSVNSICYVEGEYICSVVFVDPGMLRLEAN